MYSSSNKYVYRRPSDASDSSSITLTDEKCYGTNNIPSSSNYNNNYGNYSGYNGSYYNPNDEEYKNLPYRNSYSGSTPMTINRGYSNYNNFNYDGSYNNNYTYGSSSLPMNNTEYLDSYGHRRHRRSLSVGNTPNTHYGSYGYDSDDGVFRNNNNIYITRSTSSPTRRIRYNSDGSVSSFFRERDYNHTNPIDYLDLPVNDTYSRRRRYRRNSKSGDYYYPLERKKSFLESLTSKFKKLRFGSDKYDDDDDYYDEDEYYRRRRYSDLVRNNTMTNSISNGLNNYDQYNMYNNYDNNNMNNYYNGNYNGNYNNYNNGYNNYNNYNNNYNNNIYNTNYNNEMYPYNGNNDINNRSFTNNNRSCSDFTSQPPAQQLVKAPTIEDSTNTSLYNYYNNSNNGNNNYNSWNNGGYNNGYNNNILDNQPYNPRNSNENLYNCNYTYGNNNYLGSSRRCNSMIFQGRNNSFYSNMNNDPYNNGNVYNGNRSSCLYNSYNNKNLDFQQQEDGYYNNLKNNLYVTNNHIVSDDEANYNLSKYKLKHRRRKSSLKEYVDSNYYSNNYDCNPKYYRVSRQPSKVTFDRNVQYWNN